MSDITYNVRVYKTKIYKGTRVTTYYVRWKVGPREWKEPHRTAAQADSFRSSLLTAARNGERLQSRHRAAGRLEARGEGHDLVRLRLLLCGPEVEERVGQVPQGHRPRAHGGYARDGAAGTRPTRRREHPASAAPLGIQRQATRQRPLRRGTRARMGRPHQRSGIDAGRARDRPQDA